MNPKLMLVKESNCVTVSYTYNLFGTFCLQIVANTKSLRLWYAISIDIREGKGIFLSLFLY